MLILYSGRETIDGKTSFALMLAENAAIHAGAVVGVKHLKCRKSRWLCACYVRRETSMRSASVTDFRD